MVPTDSESKDGIVKENQNVTNMFSKVGNNDLTAFKNYLEEKQNKVDTMASLVRYQYNITPQVYTIGATNKVTKLNPSEILEAMAGDSIMSSSSISIGGATMSVFYEMVDDMSMI